MKSIVLAFTLLISFNGLSATVQFNLRTPAIESVDEAASILLNQDGLVATFETPDGLLNQTAASFGINAFASGDATSLIEPGERLYIRFNQTVQLLGFNISSLSSGEIGLIRLATGDTQFSQGGDYRFESGYELAAGDALELTALLGSYSFNSISVNTAEVPEPASIVLFLMAFGMLILRRRFHSDPI